MKSSLLTCTSAEGLKPLRWLSFTVSAGSSYAPLSASFTPANIQILTQAGSAGYPSYTYRFINVAAMPGWVQPGTGIHIVASVTISTVSRDISDYYIVRAVSADGKTFDVDAPRPHGGMDGAAIYQTLASTALDSGAGAQPTPLVSLVMQCQKAMFKASAGTVIISPEVAGDGTTSPYSITLASGSSPEQEYEVTAPTGAKFDLADWQAKQSGGAATLAVRFL